MKKIILILGLISLFSCTSGGDDSGSTTTDDFDRTALLNSIVENNILPAYADLDSKLESLQSDISAFVTNPEASALATVKESYLNAYKVWQHVQMFNVLLASETGYKEDMNTYPVDATEINSFLDGSFGQAISEINFTATSKNDAQGFPAIDYLINNGENSEVIANFSSGDNAAEYIELLTLYINRMIELTDAIIADWNTNKASFVADDTNTITSSFNLLINDYIFFIEKGFRESKIAFPAGVRDNVVAYVLRVESFYSADNSKVLFTEAYTAIQNVFTGTPYNSQNTTPVGIDDYLDAVNAEVYVDNEGNVALATYIKNNLFTNIDVIVDDLNANFVTQIEIDNTKMEATFNAIQDFVVALKVNALEAFSVDVDYVDSDGD